LHFIPTTTKHEADALANKRRSVSEFVEVTGPEMEALGICNSRFDFYFKSCPKGKIFLPNKDGVLEESDEEKAREHFSFLERTRTHYWSVRKVKGKPYKYRRKLLSPLFDPVRTTIPPWLLEYWREAKLTEPEIMGKLVGLVKKGGPIISELTGREVVAGTIHLDSGIPHIEWCTVRCADPALQSDLLGTKGLGLASEWFCDTWAMKQIGWELEGKKKEDYDKARAKLYKDFPGFQEQQWKSKRQPLDLRLKAGAVAAFMPAKDAPMRPTWDRAVATYTDWKKNKQAVLLSAAMDKKRSVGQKLANDAVTALLRTALGQKRWEIELAKFGINAIVQMVVEGSKIVDAWLKKPALDKGGMEMA
jgi:hypothetical protein